MRDNEINPASTAPSLIHCTHGTRPKPAVVVLTGGPGAGKTAVLEMVKQHCCPHIVVLQEAASILFGGGFPRNHSPVSRRAAQRAIFHVQVELEHVAADNPDAQVILCDRGTIDGLAYWVGDEAEFWQDVHSTRQTAFDRYNAVIHLRTPSIEAGYNYRNPVRTETAAEAAVIDERLAQIWDGHSNRSFVDSTDNFMDKAAQALALIESFLNGGPQAAT